MNELDRQEYRQRYRERLAQFQHDPRTLGWTKGNQAQRFAALTGLLPLDRLRSVLDVGCGFGDLFPFLRERGFRGRYTGLDFIPELIEVGQHAYPEAQLLVGDFSTMDSLGTFDLVLASGIFNARLQGEDHWTYLTATLRRMHAHCNVAASADFLSTTADRRRPDLYFTSPEEVLAWARSLTRRTALLHHYMPFEFALYLFRDDRVTDRSLFPPLAPADINPANGTYSLTCRMNSTHDDC